jgi:hypothetical protein
MGQIALLGRALEAPHELQKVAAVRTQTARSTDGEMALYLLARQAPQPDGKQIEGAGEAGRQMPGVAREDLIPAHAAEDYGELLARRGAHQVRADRGRVGDRLVHVPDQAGQQLRHLGLDDPLVVVDRERLGDLARVAHIVGHDVVRQILLREADRVGADRSRRGGHLRHYGARIEPAAEEAAQRYV